MRSFGVAAATVALLSSGCFDEEHACANVFPEPKKELPSINTDVPTVESDTPGADVPGAPACACTPAVGSWYRFNELGITKISGAADLVTTSLNALWSEDVKNLELNILFRLDGLVDGQIVLTAFSGARVGDTVCYIEASKFETSLAAATCTYGPKDGVALTVYSGSPEQPKNCIEGGTPDGVSIQAYHAIPVSEVALLAEHTGVCDGTPADSLTGRLTGSIGQGTLGSLCTCIDPSSDNCGPPDNAFTGKDDGACVGCAKSYAPLKQLLLGLNGGNDLDYSCKTGDGAPAACIEADFKAQAMAAAPVACDL